MEVVSWIPTIHRIQSHQLGQGLLRRPDLPVIGIVWGPVSLLWDRKFKREAAKPEYRRVG